MSCDKLVFDLSQEVEGSPNVFIRKDWINILDNQNQNYQNNQSIIDTSQLANSNKYMSYREAYLSVPLLLTLVSTVGAVAGPAGNQFVNDYAFGLKNWFGTLIHSFTLDYNGTTIVQQTPFCNMWNSFKLMTTLSWGDIITQGSTIGFYPDTAGAWSYQAPAAAGSPYGLSVCNSDNALFSTITSGLQRNVYNQSLDIVDDIGAAIISNNRIADVNNQVKTELFIGGNEGLTYRTKWIAYNPYAGGINAATAATPAGGGIGTSQYLNAGRPIASATQTWTSYVQTQIAANTATRGVFQVCVMATIYLKHVHSFFNMCPLLKGVFMKITMNLNNADVSLTTAGLANAQLITSYASNVPVGGVNPIMIPSIKTGSKFLRAANAPVAGIQLYNLSVGATCLNPAMTAIPNVTVGQLSKSVYLYVPSYTFNPTFEQAYLSNNVKQIKYTDIYQYQVLNVASVAQGGQFNNLVTNGIANIKSVLIIPFFRQGVTTANVAAADYAEYQSPFDTAGAGGTAPMVTLGNFNVQISGQNAIYNMQRYTFEEWNNQLYGQYSVNGGLTDGLTSGLIGFSDFLHTYGFYYVNVERMLPVEQSVPKSVQILGTNYSSQALNLWVFIEYGVQVSIDVLTGARV